MYSWNVENSNPFIPLPVLFNFSSASLYKDTTLTIFVLIDSGDRIDPFKKVNLFCMSFVNTERNIVSLIM